MLRLVDGSHPGDWLPSHGERPCTESDCADIHSMDDHYWKYWHLSDYELEQLELDDEN